MENTSTKKGRGIEGKKGVKRRGEWNRWAWKDGKRRK